MVRSTWNLILYQKYPNLMIFWMVENSVFWINALHVNRRMSCTISPQTLIPGTNINFTKRSWIEFGGYYEACENNSPLNSTQSQTEPAICLSPSVNPQGSYWFLNLRTGRRIKQRKYNPLTIPTRIIATCTRLPTPTTRILVLIVSIDWEILSKMSTHPKRTMKMMAEVLKEWRKMATETKNKKSQEWTTKRKLQEWKH